MIVSPGNMTELIDVLFGTQVSSGNYVLDGVQILMQRGNS